MEFWGVDVRDADREVAVPRRGSQADHEPDPQGLSMSCPSLIVIPLDKDAYLIAISY